MNQSLTPQTSQPTEQIQKPSEKRTTFIAVGIMALAIALALDYINNKHTYVSPYENWMFIGSILIYVSEVYILYVLLKLFKIIDTSFSSRIILVGLSSLAFDIMQYLFLPKVDKGGMIELSIGLIVFLTILFSLIKNIYKAGSAKTIGLGLSFLVTIFLVSGLILFGMSKFIS